MQMFQKPFQDYSAAVFIRNLTHTLIQPYANTNKIFQSEELRPLLIQVFKYREYEVSYELMKVLCFGKNKYISISLQELIDYFMQKYLGENTINNYAYQKGYARRDQKIMNKSEFIQTLTLGLVNFIGFNMSLYSSLFQDIFDQLDKNKAGTVSQSLYCQFLKYYLGSQSPMAINPTKRITQISQSQELISLSPKQKQENLQENAIEPLKYPIKIQVSKFALSNKEITAQSLSNRSLKLPSALDQFHDLLVFEITVKSKEYDQDKDGFLTKKNSQKFLYEVLELQYHSIDFIINSYFNFSKSKTISYQQLIEIVCQVHFRQIFTNIIKGELKEQLPHKIFMKKEYFVQKILQNCYFFTNKPNEQLIERVFDQLLLKSGHRLAEQISLQDFRAFILVQCCNNRLIFRGQKKKSSRNLTIPPDSIMQVQNSNYQQDDEENGSFHLSRKQLQNSHQSHSKQYISQSKNNSQAQIAFSSNKQIKVNKLSEKRIITPNQLSVPQNIIPPSGKQIEQISQTLIDIKRDNIQSFQSSIDKVSSQDKFSLNFNQSIKQKEQKRSFKDIIWMEIQNKVYRYVKSSQGQLNKDECHKLFDSEAVFKDDRVNMKNKLARIYSKQGYIGVQMLVGYIIHLKGEEALINFNKKQIKGKSTLNQVQIAQILYQAYGIQLGSNKIIFQEFSKLLFIQNGKSLFLYKNYLQLIARNLSIKNSF